MIAAIWCYCTFHQISDCTFFSSSSSLLASLCAGTTAGWCWWSRSVWGDDPVTVTYCFEAFESQFQKLIDNETSDQSCELIDKVLRYIVCRDSWSTFTGAFDVNCWAAVTAGTKWTDFLELLIIVKKLWIIANIFYMWYTYVFIYDTYIFGIDKQNRYQIGKK